jgi:hypothetical protein
MDTLMVYLPRISARAEYIIPLILRDLMGAEVILTESVQDYTSYTGPRIEYCTEQTGEGIFMQACELLFQTSVTTQSPELFTYRNYPAFFSVQDERSAFPFDLFAAAFYLITRYEEYLPFVPDKFGRFKASDSIASKGNFLRLPIVNLWANLLKDLIMETYPAIKLRDKEFRFIPTIDIDHAYAFKQRTLFRTLGGYGTSLIAGDIKKIAYRTKVLIGLMEDPFNQYETIRDIHEQIEVIPLYFVLFADYGKDDNNVTLSGNIFRQLLRRLDDSGTLGIHPSLTSGKNPQILHKEITGLGKLLRHEIELSRQHFLKVSFPETFRLLIKNGIHHDYSIGYASDVGFRAGIAYPFPFFDLISDRQENLMIHPVTLMDVTLKDYLQKNPDEAIAECRSFVDAIKAIKGEFISVWHNESFDESGRWKGWTRVYKDLLFYSTGMMLNE